jgi:hypothetical protein
MQKFLDKLCQPPYHETEAIYLSSQSVQVNDKKLRVFGVLCLIFRTMCTVCLYKISRFLPNISRNALTKRLRQQKTSN